MSTNPNREFGYREFCNFKDLISEFNDKMSKFQAELKWTADEPQRIQIEQPLCRDESHSSKIYKLEKKVFSLDKENAELFLEIEELEREVSQARQELVEVKEDADRMICAKEREHKLARRQLELLADAQRDELLRMKKELQSSAVESSQRNSRNSDVYDQIRELKEQLADVQTQMSIMSSDHEKLKRQKEGLLEEIQDFSIEVDTLNDTIDSLKMQLTPISEVSREIEPDEVRDNFQERLVVNYSEYETGAPGGDPLDDIENNNTAPHAPSINGDQKPQQYFEPRRKPRT